MNHTSDGGANLMKTGDHTELPPGDPPDLESDEPVEDDSDSAPHMGCGFGRCRPRFLQVFANPIVFMIVLNTYCFVEGAIVSGKPPCSILTVVLCGV